MTRISIYTVVTLCFVTVPLLTAAQDTGKEIAKDEAARQLANADPATWDRFVREGHELSNDQVRSLEKNLNQNPRDLVTRVRLIGYYYPKSNSQEHNKSVWKDYSRLVLGIIENNPESELAGSTGAKLVSRFYDLSETDAWDSGAKNWDKLIAANPTSASILGQAATYYSSDVFRPTIGKQVALLEKAEQLDPKNPRWSLRLGNTLLQQVRLENPPKAHEVAAKALNYLERANMQQTNKAHAGEYANLAKAAFLANQWSKAETYAQMGLTQLKTEEKDWNYGNLFHDLHIVIGRAAMRKGNVQFAGRELLEAGKTPGSPQLNSFGPDFVLARELLEKNETSTVLAYLDSVDRFWGSANKNIGTSNDNSLRVLQENGALLEKWRKEIRAGQIPQDRRWQKQLRI